MRSGLTLGRSGLLPLGLPASGLTEGRSAGLVLLPGRLSPGRLSPGRLPGRVTLIGLSLSSDLNPPLSEGFVPAEGLVPPDEGLVVTEGFVAGLSTVMLGLRSDEEPVDGRVAVPVGLPEVDGFIPDEGFVPPDGFVPDEGLTDWPDGVVSLPWPDCDEPLLPCDEPLLTVADDFEADGVVLVTFALLDVVVLEVVPVVRDSPLRACASASDSNATNDKAAIIAASAVLIVLIIVQF